MIQFNNNNKFINDRRVSTIGVTYPRSVRFFTGVYDNKIVMHNLKLKIKQNISDQTSNLTYVRGDMTDWYLFKHDRDFSKFFTEVMDIIQPVLAPDLSLSKELICNEAWGNLLKKGDIVADHIHQSYHGILYLTEGTPLKFPELDMTFTPKPGDWIISEPQIYHGTDEITDDKERINVVFNFDLNTKFRHVNAEYDNVENWNEKLNK